MTAPELRQEIIDAMKSVAWCDDQAKRLDVVEVEAETVMEAVERYVKAMTAQQGRVGGK